MSVFSKSPEDIKKYHREYYRKNNETMRYNARKRYSENRGNIKEYRTLYYQRNREDLIEKNKTRYKGRKEIVKKKANEKFNCECGGRFTRANKNVHIKTKMHLKHLEGETIKIKIIN